MSSILGISLPCRTASSSFCSLLRLCHSFSRARVTSHGQRSFSRCCYCEEVRERARRTSFFSSRRLLRLGRRWQMTPEDQIDPITMPFLNKKKKKKKNDGIDGYLEKLSSRLFPTTDSLSISCRCAIAGDERERTGERTGGWIHS